MTITMTQLGISDAQKKSVVDPNQVDARRFIAEMYPDFYKKISAYASARTFTEQEWENIQMWAKRYGFPFKEMEHVFKDFVKFEKVIEPPDEVKKKLLRETNKNCTQAWATRAPRSKKAGRTFP